MENRQRVVVTGFTISFAVWLIVLSFLIYSFLRDLSEERGAGFSYEELREIALDFKYFCAVLFIGIVGLSVLSAKQTNPIVKRKATSES